MAEVRKQNFFKGVISEFKKIIWPNFSTLMKQTWTVVFVSAVVGGIVALIDFGYTTGLKFLIG